MRRRAGFSIARRLTLYALSPPCFAIGFAIGGCGFSARDDFFQIRSAQLVAMPGDRSAFAPRAGFPTLAGFSAKDLTLTSASDMLLDP